MSKVAEYLQGHIIGELSVRSDVRDALSTDGSILSVKPELVVYPANTKDIQKIARFTWQLAQKGHTLPATPRGYGADTTGASLSTGVVLCLPTHMNHIFEHDTKQKLVRVQGGVSLAALQDALHLDNSRIAAVDREYASVGGAISNDSCGMFSGKYGSIGANVKQLEVVLPSGEILQTERISARELERRKGYTTAEGQLYRDISGIIEDHEELLDQMREESIPDSSGYSGLAYVKDKRGFDLTPLFVGAQGTLGVITEAILQTNSEADNVAYVAFSVETLVDAQEIIDDIRSQNPALLEIYDMHYIRQAQKHGRSFAWTEGVLKIDDDEVIVICGFDEAMRQNKKAVRSVRKTLNKRDIECITSDEVDEVELLALRQAPSHIVQANSRVQQYAPKLFSGIYIPHEAFNDCIADFDTLGEKLNLDLPVYGSALSGIYSLRVALSPKSVTDKQKIFKLIDGITQITQKYGGNATACNGEGRLFSPAVNQRWSDEHKIMYEKVRDAFDVHRTFNPDTKARLALKDVAKLLRNETTVHQPEHPTTI